MAKTNTNIPAQGSGDVALDETLIDHTVTQEDLDLNPDLVDEGVVVDEVVQIPEQSDVSGYVVLKSFRDRDNFNIEYNEDSDISHLSQDRIDHLLSIGYIKAND
jgi:hypothetical protein